MSTPSSQIPTNPGRSENVAKQASLAEAIAANLTAGRQGAEPEQSKDSPPDVKPSEIKHAQADPEVHPEAVSSESEQAQDAPESHDLTQDEDSDRYTLSDFASAADLSEDELLDRLVVKVPEMGNEETPLRDVLRGYRYESANTKRAQEIAEQRRQLEAKTGEISQMHDRAEAVLQAQWGELDQEEQAIEQQYRAVNWAGLQARQDGSYADTEAQFSRARQEIARRREKLGNAYQTVQQQRQALLEKQIAEQQPRDRERLLELVPEWRDQSTLEREARDAGQFMIERYGYTPQEVNETNDPRLIAALRRLWVLEQQASAVPAAAKKVAKAPKVVKPGQAANRQSAREKRVRQLKGNLRRSGNRHDLAALVLETRIRG